MTSGWFPSSSLAINHAEYIRIDKVFDICGNCLSENALMENSFKCFIVYLSRIKHMIFPYDSLNNIIFSLHIM